MSFSKIVGQTKAIALLQADLKSDRIAESYLFVGHEGVGKRTVALEFAKALNCKGEDASKNQLDIFSLASGQHPASDFNVCDSCSSCHKIDAGTHPDVFTLNFETQSKLLEMDEEKTTKQKEYHIASIRILIKQSYLTPLEAKKKVFIIDGAEHLNRESANALLKVLEESPRLCHWILLSSSVEQVIPTIRSRCRKVHFAPLNTDEIKSILSKINPAAVNDVAEICDGSVGIALSLMKKESLEFIRLSDDILRERDNSESNVSYNPIQESGRILSENKKVSSKKQVEELLKILSLKISCQMRAFPDPSLADRLGIVFQSQEELRRNVSPQLILDSLLLSFCDKK